MERSSPKLIIDTKVFPVNPKVSPPSSAVDNEQRHQVRQVQVWGTALVTPNDPDGREDHLKWESYSGPCLFLEGVLFSEPIEVDLECEIEQFHSHLLI